MKRILAFVLVVLMAASILWGCQASGTQSSNTTPSTTELSEERTYEIQLAFYDFFAEEYSGDPGIWLPMYHQGYGWGICYLGSAEGYDFVYYYHHYGDRGGNESNLAEQGYSAATAAPAPSFWIGDVEFEETPSGGLRAYKDGKLHYVKDLYDEGVISRDTLLWLKEKRAQCHEEWMAIPDKNEAADGEIKWYEEWGGHVPPERE